MQCFLVISALVLVQHNTGAEAATHHRDLDETLRELRMLLGDAELSEQDVREVVDGEDVNEVETGLVVHTFGGNADGADCVFPFRYDGENQTTCITRWNDGILFCGTTYDYDTDKRWGNCEAIATFGGNSVDGSLCRFPFEYQGTTYSECISADNNDINWCYTTDGNWGNCRAIRTSGGNGGGAICKFPFSYYSKEYTSCTGDGSNGVEWCATTRDYESDGQWGYCGDMATFGGNANGSFCSFQYIYGGATYSSCITAGNDGVPWCATTSDYDTDQKWGNCRVGECGYRPIVQDGDRIVGGFEAIYGAFPWTASTPYISLASLGYSPWCGGTIISDRWIVSASHCFSDGAIDEYLVLAGNQVNSAQDKYEQVLKLEKLINHGPNGDIALLRVDGRIYFNNYTQAACLPEESADIYMPGATGIISGWGALEEGKSGPDVLNAAHVPLVDQTWCENQFSSVTSYMVCAGYLEGGVDTCQGDSGGPLVQNISDIYTLTGVTSWGYGCARPESPGVYTRVQDFLPWINQTIFDNP